MGSRSDRLSLKYHDLFDYPLTTSELKHWKTGPKFKIYNLQFTIRNKNKYFFVKGREEIIKKRIQREKYSRVKLKIAKSITYYLKPIPSVLFVGITGALAMKNASKNSDIDLMIITKANTLWLTRLCVYCMLHATGYKLRKPHNKNQRDALCINLWLDESDLAWPKNDRNIYTAHEIAQIVPLVNKNRTYEKFLWKNRWTLDFWPKAVKISSTQQVASSMQKTILHSTFYMLQSIMEKVAFKIQHLYMKPKITREVVTPTRAIFHPNDWGKKVLKKLSLIQS